jgi:hypothetical protein
VTVTPHNRPDQLVTPSRSEPIVRTVPATAVALAAALAVGACSGGNPQVDLSQAGPGALPTETVTVTEEHDRTVTATTTVVTTATVTATPTVTVTELPRPALTTSAVFNQALALADYNNLVVDIRTLDHLPLAGSAAAVQLDTLARHFAALGANGAPPSLDPPSYYGRLKSLELFAAAAAQEATANSPQAASRYSVIRQETGVFLSLVNGALRTAFVLPPAPSPSTP